MLTTIIKLIDWIEFIYKNYICILIRVEFSEFTDLEIVFHQIDDPLDEHLTPYKRERNERIPVALKRLHNSKSVSKEFLDELKAHHRCAIYGMRFLKCYGISRHPERNDLVMVMQFAKGDETLAIDIIKYNRRPRVPEGTPNCYRDLMERCWDGNKDNRPKVHKIKSILDQWRHNPPYSVLQEFRESDKLPKVLPSDEEIDMNEPSHNAAPIHTRAINTAIDTSVRNHDEFQGKSNLYTGTSIVDPGIN
ncbi:2908_t:CDS:2 [Funneliformis mosseae]|uniref:2908_t:CDS:1 n=1 Tax=Funneliformis mosseae TaxID=27381 RepID=A0A9N9FT42_FUNMO|nr:2908_t:CDS:2 [Funneliformis mosseae]